MNQLFRLRKQNFMSTKSEISELLIWSSNAQQIYAIFLNKTFIKIDWNWQKTKQKLSYTLRLNFCYLKNICFLYPRYHSRIIEHILKSIKMDKSIYFNVIIWRFILKMAMKMGKRTQSHNINRWRFRHVSTCIKQRFELISRKS